MTKTAPRRNRAEAEKGTSPVKAVSKNSHHKMPRKPTSTNDLTERNGFEFCKDLLARQLSSVPGIDAVFIYEDNEGLVHVYSLVPDFSFDLYKQLPKRERIIENKFPEIRFEFHIRAHQGRKVAQAVPLEARPVFVR
jgi:hypothetical protein